MKKVVKKFCAVFSSAFLLLPMVSLAQNWLPMFETPSGSLFSLQPGSLSVVVTPDGKEHASIIGRTETNGTINFEKWSVETSDCKRRMGRVVYLTVNGEYKFSVDFVLGGGNVVSTIADTICDAYSLGRE